MTETSTYQNDEFKHYISLNDFYISKLNSSIGYSGQAPVLNIQKCMFLSESPINCR